MSDLEATPRRIRSLVTGANTGIGHVTARELARRGDHVVIACRSEAKAHTAMATIMAETGNTALEPLVLDLADLGSVQRAASELLASGEPLDVVVANAGIGGQRGLTPQGFELHFGTNHLGHFLFVTQLLPLIEAAEAGRVVVVSSMAHLDPPGIDFGAVRSGTKAFTGYPEYAVSKLANVLFAQELARRTPERVFVGSVHPGVVATDVWRRMPWPLRPIYIRAKGMITPEQGARSSLLCATSDGVLAHRGGYWSETVLTDPSPVATPELGAELWQRSEEWVAAFG